MSNDVVECAKKLPALVNGNERLLWRGRMVTLELMLGLGELPCRLVIERGRIVDVICGPTLLRPWRFALRGPLESWRRHWEPMPAPHFHDLFAMSKRGHLVIEGDIQPLMANLFYFKDVLAAPRKKAVQ